MEKYTLSFTDAGIPTVNGKELVSRQSGSGMVTYRMEGSASPFVLHHNVRNGEMFIESKNGKDQIFAIDAKGLKHLQGKEMLLSEGHKTSFALTEDATKTVKSGDLTYSQSGESLVVGGAYFRKLTMDADGLVKTFSALGKEPNGMDNARLQASHSQSIGAILRETDPTYVAPAVKDQEQVRER